MKTKAASRTMVALRTLAVIVCGVLMYSAALAESAPTELIHNNVTGTSPRATKAPTMIVPSSLHDAKPWPPQKPARSKHITKSNLYKKPPKDKSGWTKHQAAEMLEEKTLYSSTLVPTGYDVKKDNSSRHKEAPSNGGTDTPVDNVNGPKDYTNKSSTNSSTLQHFISHTGDTTESIPTNVDEDDDSGKDIDFISVAGTTKADETYATPPLPPLPAAVATVAAASPTEGYHAKEEGGVTTTTMQASLVENPNFNAEPIAKMSTKSSRIKSISSPTMTPTPTSAPGKSLPEDASVGSSSSSSSSLSFSQQSVATTMTTTEHHKLDVGHDGVKITKKKQLFDKHFIAAPGPSSSIPSGSLPAPISKDNPWTLSKNKPAKSGKKLMEVPNGYLGPIMMKEKTFSVSHHPKKQKPSIVDQLRDKKLVEIIAPTALMEPTIKVKSSIPQPEFVAIDSVSLAASSTSTTTTEGTSTPTHPPMIPTAATTKDEEIESETATTYFLVVTQDSKAESGKLPADSKEEPLNAGEIETTLKEIYTKVLNAMEEASKNNPSHSKKPAKVDTDFSEAQTTKSTVDSKPAQTSDHLIVSVTDRLDDHPAPPTDDLLFQAVTDPQPSVITEASTVPTTDSHHTSTPVIDHVSKNMPPTTASGTDHRSFEAAITPTSAPHHEFATQLSSVQVQGGTPSSITEHMPLLSTVSQPDSSNESHDHSPVIVDVSTLPPIQQHNASGTLGSRHTVTPVTDDDATIIDLTFSPVAPHYTSTEGGSTLAPLSDHSLRSVTDGIHKSTAQSLPSFNSESSSSSTSSPMVHHDSSTGAPSTSTQLPITTISDLSPTFATITTDAFTSSSTSQQQALKPTHDSEQTESKISDIQIEVYDSTVESIVASTNFKDNAELFYPSSHTTTKQAPSNPLPQERFTQYVVDKATDFATQDSNSVAKASGKPEPAAIEIHINVSEGFGNESEDLEFSYRQSDYRKVTPKKPANANFITLKPFDTVPQNETSNEAAEEIVVEIIDANSNSTENSASRENLNVNPIFTFRSDDDSQVELKNVKYYPEDRPKERAKNTDDFFVPHLGQQPPGGSKPLIDRDSDTIFYISNTEVKVGESLPTTNSYDAQLKRSRLESQFFPADYEERKKASPQRYEEDIILSPLKNRASDPLKLVRGPLDISYVGESVMEVEQVTVTTTIPPPILGSTPDVIIQPAVLPEMAIGVPVIGELPPQIELKEIDFMPNFDGAKEDSSIQYGGDLIDEGGAMGAGFDMDSYPLGNMGMGQKTVAISSQMLLNHRVNHFKKDELSADLAASSETADGNDLLRRSNDSVNGTVIGEKMGNATAYSVMEGPRPGVVRVLSFADVHTLLMACLITLLPLGIAVALAFGLRRLYRKFQTSAFMKRGRNSSTDPLDAEKGTAGDGETEGVETPEEFRASSLAFGATTDPSSSEICTNSNELNGNASIGDGRDCNGSVANGRATSDMGVHCIQTIIPDGVQEENAIFIVNCNTETQPTAPPIIPPQSATTTTNAAATPTGGAGTMQCNYSGANGSITTMTLKNNHLIVETEERNDISRDARETKMHYNNSEKDGVFVVEVSRGADSKIMPGSPVADSSDKCPFNMDSAVRITQNGDDKLRSGHEEVQVHPPPPDNVNVHDEIESNHLHQIDEVDEFEEGPKITKHSNTGLSQSDLSSSSSVDSNKRYSYGNQELYTIEQQDYTTPSPAATKPPHPHTEPQLPQPENHNDDNGHSENGHCLDNDDPATAPNCDSTIYPADADSDVNGHSGVESKPKITAALLKQDTVIVNDVTNGLSHNGNGEQGEEEEEEEVDDEEEKETTPHQAMEKLSNGVSPVNKTGSIAADYTGDTENGFDSIISLPDPPSTEEMKQMNDIILMETNQLDSLPPPPPPATENHCHQNGNGNAAVETENGDDAHSIVSSTSPMNTPTKMMKPSAPPTITMASAPDIPHTNGNCMTVHTTASTAAVVEVSGSS